LNLQAGESLDNMICNIDQQGYNLRSKLAPAKSSPQKEKFVAAKPVLQNDKHVAPTVQTCRKNPERKKAQPAMKVSALEADKFSSPFILEHEISKIKIPIPLTKLVKTNSYRSYIFKWLQPSFVIDPVTDVINLQDEKPTIVLGPIVEERDDSTPPFYVSLNVHDKIIHNILLDSRHSHNIMPNIIME
jgi:hypothetical protein